MSQPIITYCGNVHPVVGLSDLEQYLDESTPSVQNHFGAKFPLGLWLPKTAMQDALSEKGLASLRGRLETLETMPVTFNAFPMEVFHGTRVKELVYTPDWSTRERLDYTKSVAQLGVKLGMKSFSISSLSGGFKPNDKAEKVTQYLEHWLQWVDWARSLEENESVRVSLALEPEPFNTMEDESDAIQLWAKLREAAKVKGISEEYLQRYLGLCFDTCHFSVRYVSLTEAWERLKQHSIPVHKIQVSVAPRWQASMGEESRMKFFNWEEPVYLHQSFAKVAGQRQSFLDLDLAKRYEGKVEEWRTHFHVPIHFGHREDSTGFELIDFLNYLKMHETEIPVLEVETYSFNSMGEQWGEQTSLEQSIAKEMLWLQEQMS